MHFSKISASKAHQDRVTSLLFLDNEVLVSASWDGKLSFWEVQPEGLKLKHQIKNPGQSYEALFVSNNREHLIALADNSTIDVWNLEKNQLKNDQNEKKEVIIINNNVAINTSRKRIKLGYEFFMISFFEYEEGRDPETMKTDIPNKEIQACLEDMINSYTNKTYCSRNGTLKLIPNQAIINGEIGKYIEFKRNFDTFRKRFCNILIRNVKTGEERILRSRIKDGHSDYITSIVISKDDKHFISASADKTIKTWSLESDTMVQTLNDFKHSIESLALSEDEEFLICGTMDGSIHFFKKKVISAEEAQKERLERLNARKRDLLFKTASVADLKQLCREKGIKGYSRYRKAELVKFVLNSLSEEEIEEALVQKTSWIYNKIKQAFYIINSNKKDIDLPQFYSIDEEKSYFRIFFVEFDERKNAMFSLSNENINNPEFDCDCGLGINGGLCVHFWLGFIFALKKGFFELSNWNLTPLPPDFERKIKNVKININQEKSEHGNHAYENITLRRNSYLHPQKQSSAKKSRRNTSEEDSPLLKLLDTRITVYEGEISSIEKKEYEYKTEKVEYYMVSLKNVRFGPQIKKTGDYKEEEIKTIEHLKVRLSDNAFSGLKLKDKDKITLNGRVVNEKFQGVHLKRATKVNRV